MLLLIYLYGIMAKYQLIKRKSNRASDGFTLIEMIVSVGVFSVIMVISVGALLTAFDAFQKTRLLRNTMENVNIATESMIKKIRTATHVDCTVNGLDETPTLLDNCVDGDNAIEFLGSDGVFYEYGWVASGHSNPLFNKRITIKRDGGTEAAITSSEIEITSLVFYVDGVADNLKQDIVTVTISGFANLPGKSKFDTRFHLQTTVSKRILDIFGS